MNIDERVYGYEPAASQLAELRADLRTAAKLNMELMEIRRENEAEIERLRAVVTRRADEAQRDNALLAVLDLRIRQLLTWVENVATDEQLDTPVPALCGSTGRGFFTESTR